MNQIISTPAAPAAIGPYSQAIQAGGLLFLSGTMPIDPATGALDRKEMDLPVPRGQYNYFR